MAPESGCSGIGPLDVASPVITRTQVAGLTEMKRGMAGQMQQERAGPEGQAHHRLWKRRVERFPGKTRQHVAHDTDCRVEFGRNLGTCAGAAPEFELAVADTARAAEHAADEVLQAARDVQGQVGGGVGDAWNRLPDGRIVRKEGELALQALELADHCEGEVVGGLVHLPCLMKVPARISATASRSSSSVFITIGINHATGSSMGFPDTSRKRTPCSPA